MRELGRGCWTAGPWILTREHRMAVCFPMSLHDPGALDFVWRLRDMRAPMADDLMFDDKENGLEALKFLDRKVVE